MTRAEALQLLELNEGFTDEQLNAAYRKKAKTYHPDNRDTGDEALYVKFGEAKQRLGPDWAKQRAQEYQHSIDFLIDATITEATNELIGYRERRNVSEMAVRDARRRGEPLPYGIQELVLSDDPITLTAIMPAILQKLADDIKDFALSVKNAEAKLELLQQMLSDCEGEPETNITHRYRQGLNKRIGDEKDNIRNLTDVRKATQQVRDMFEQQRQESTKVHIPLFLSNKRPRIPS